MSTTLVLYVFHEYNERVKYFMENAVFLDKDVDFYIVCNNKHITFEHPYYIKILRRENIGYDFGGWSEALLTNDFYKKYDNFIFVNSSVIGPFLPSISTLKWTDIFLNGLTGETRLFGATINTLRQPLDKSHLQSYIFCMNKETLEYLIQCKIFSLANHAKTMLEAIFNKEVMMSRKIIENDWNIGSLLPYYKGVDFRFKAKKPQFYNVIFLDDVMFQGYYRKLWTEYDLVFVKGNRIKLSNM